eukprot:Hpha_TRINITY_DN33672_c0_g1::TRINITY_DN33672_c0_g1_i1::g.43326::m.43326
MGSRDPALSMYSGGGFLKPARKKHARDRISAWGRLYNAPEPLDVDTPRKQRARPPSALPLYEGASPNKPVRTPGDDDIAALARLHGALRVPTQHRRRALFMRTAHISDASVRDILNPTTDDPEPWPSRPVRPFSALPRPLTPLAVEAPGSPTPAPAAPSPPPPIVRKALPTPKPELVPPGVGALGKEERVEKLPRHRIGMRWLRIARPSLPSQQLFLQRIHTLQLKRHDCCSRY